MLEAVQEKASVTDMHDYGTWQWDSDSLLELNHELVSVDQETEAGFLELGSRVENFHSRACEISGSAGEVMHLLNGDAGENSLQHLQLLVERCNLWLNSTDKKSVEISTLLSSVYNEITRLDTPVHGLRKVIKTLHSLRVSTRIEASKGYASGARVLAKSLNELGDLVYEKINQICDLRETLVPMIRESMEMESSTRTDSIRTAGSEVQQARRLLGEIVENCVKTEQWTDRLKDRSDEVANSFGEMIAALQFQDITRQRLEHIRKALASLDQHAGKLGGCEEDSRSKDVASLFGRICRLQHDQLVFACDEYCSAAANLTENLNGMVSSVLSMAEDTKELARSADVDNEHRFDAVLAVLKTISSHLDGTRKIHHAAGDRLTEVCNGINRVAGLVGEIEQISEEMQLVAMNAAISAAHAHQKGVGLDVIAQNIHAVAEEATAHALVLAKECEAITSHAMRLQDVEQGTQSSAADIGDLLGEARERIATIEQTSNRLVTLTGEVDRKASELAVDVNDVVRTIGLKESFQEKIAPVVARLDALGAVAQDVSLGTVNANLDALFQELEYCYTMDSERQLHQQYMSGAAMADQDEADELAARRDHGLGDNVDLF